MPDASTTTKGSATRARILEEAVNQASVRGLAAVSLMDVAEAVGLSKSGLFKHFQAKEALHLAVLETAVARFIDQVWTPAAAQPTARARLDRFFEGRLDWAGGYWRGGCPLMTAARELEQQPGDLRDYVVGQLNRLDAAEAALVRGLDAGISPAAADQAVFELNGLVSSYRDSLVLGDGRARDRALAGYARVLQSLG